MKISQKPFTKKAVTLAATVLLSLYLAAQRGIMPEGSTSDEDKVPFPTFFYYTAAVGFVLILMFKEDERQPAYRQVLRIVGYVLCVPVVFHVLSKILGLLGG